VVVDAATTLLPAIARNFSNSETVGLLNAGQTFEVALPTDFQYLPWQHVTISNTEVLRQVEAAPSGGTGLLVLTAVRPGVADLTADAKSATSSTWAAGFFRIEFVVRAPSQVADVVASDKDRGKTVTVQVGQILAFSLPSELPVGQQLFQGAARNQPLMIPLERPAIDDANQVRYLVAQAAGTEKIWWASCPPTQPTSASCQPEVTVDIIPSGFVAVEASDSDRGKQFTLHPGQRSLSRCTHTSVRGEVGRARRWACWSWCPTKPPPDCSFGHFERLPRARWPWMPAIPARSERHVLWTR